MKENAKWNDAKDEILDLITPVEDVQGFHMDLTALTKGEQKPQIPLKCPVCHENHAHVYMHRFPEDGQSGRGTIWIWCSRCRACTHVSRIRLPDWCENADFIEISDLTSHPVYLDQKADLIDKHLKRLLKSKSKGENTMDKNLDAVGYGISLFSPGVLQNFLQKQKIRSKKLLEKFQKDKDLYLTTQKEGIWLPLVQIDSVHYLVKLKGYDEPFDDEWEQLLHYEGFNMEIKDALWITAISMLQPFDAGAFSGSETSFQTRDGVTCYTGFKYEVPSGKYLVSVTGYARKQQVKHPEPNFGFMFSLVKVDAFDGYKNPRESDDYEFNIGWLARSKEAVIYWFSEAEGGRKQPPEEETYSASAELPDGNICHLTIIFDRKDRPQNKMEDKCRVDYLLHMKNFPPLESGMELILCDETRKRGKSVYQKVGRLVVK